MLGVVQLRLGGESGNGEGQWLFWEYLVNIRRKRHCSYCYCNFDQVLRTSELGNVYTRSDTRRCSDLVSLTSDPHHPIARPPRRITGGDMDNLTTYKSLSGELTS